MQNCRTLKELFWVTTEYYFEAKQTGGKSSPAGIEKKNYKISIKCI